LPVRGEAVGDDPQSGDVSGGMDEVDQNLGGSCCGGGGRVDKVHGLLLNLERSADGGFIAAG
jgi:hypothetical protein